MKLVISILFLSIIFSSIKCFCQNVEIIEIKKNLKTENNNEINIAKSTNLTDKEKPKKDLQNINVENKKELPTKQLNNKNTEIVKCNNNDRKGLDDEK